MNLSTISLGQVLDIGKKRPNNEDQCGFLDKENFKVLLVADGMGGHASGEVASKIAKETILKLFDLEENFHSAHQLKSDVKKVMKKANSMIHRLSSTRNELYGMGTTLVMAIITSEMTAIVNCGDSRCYSYKDGKLTQLTTDQTVVQSLYAIGAISKEEMKTSPKRHVLLNAMGVSPSIDYEITLIPNDYEGLLLCSDGLTNMVEDEEIEKIWRGNSKLDSQKLAQTMVDKALENGGIDNIATVIAEVHK